MYGRRKKLVSSLVRLVAIHLHPNLKGRFAPNQAMGGVFREI